MNRKKYGKKNTLAIAKAEIRQFFLTWRFLLSVLGIAAVCILGQAETILAAIQYPEFKLFSSLKQIENLLVFDRYKAVMVSILAGACGCGITADVREKRLQNVFSRITIAEYLRIRVVTILSVCVLATCLGFLSSVLLLRPIFPFRVPQEDSIGASNYEWLAKGRMAVLYLFLIGTNFALSASAPVIIGITLSIFCPSGYILVGGSVVAFYVMYSFSLLLPSQYSYSEMSSSIGTPYYMDLFTGILWHAGYWFVMIAVLWGIFKIIFRRRFRNGDLI